MYTTHIFSLLLVSLSLAAALPTLSIRQSSSANSTTSSPSNFFLVTTTSQDPAPDGNSSLLPSVSATSLFDPFQQSTFLLRLIGPGYGSLPHFNLSDGGSLSSPADQFGTGDVEVYESVPVVAGSELGFETGAGAGAGGGLELRDGFLLAVDGVAEGWSICTGDLGQSVIYWQGTDASCNATYIQAVSDAPY